MSVNKKIRETILNNIGNDIDENIRNTSDEVELEVLKEMKRRIDRKKMRLGNNIEEHQISTPTQMKQSTINYSGNTFYGKKRAAPKKRVKAKNQYPVKIDFRRMI